MKLLPNGLWKKLLQAAERKPDQSKAFLTRLFDDMAKGGDFDLENILEFDGGLFDGRPPLALQHNEISLLFAASSLDWSLIDPTIFGTLFERFLDPDKRAQIGAHYTDPDKIMMIVEPWNQGRHSSDESKNSVASSSRRRFPSTAFLTGWKLQSFPTINYK